jgi:hypothetical protein
MKLEEIITSPRNFFETLSGEPASLKWPLLIISLMAVISAIVGWQMGELTGRLMAGLMQGMAQITAIITAVSAFFGTFVMWLVAAVIFYVLHKLFKGTGSFTRIAQITGYGMVPQILSSLIGLLLAFYYLPQVAISPITSASASPDKINAAVQSLMQDPSLHQFTLISTILSIILFIWSANLWAFGFEACCGLDGKKAMMTAGIPVAIYIIYTLASLFLFTQGAMT